jgi:nicotinamidase-related amidase
VASPSKNLDLHGSAPDASPIALLLIDVINALDFQGAERLVEPALTMAHAVAGLKRRCAQARIPAIYVNDNFGRWRDDQHAIVARALAPDALGQPVAQLLRPEAEDYFVVKPKHSGFFATPLDTLLTYLRVRTVILTGIGTELCVLFTANDAFMRDYRLIVPSDCVAAIDPIEGDLALGRMVKLLQADVRPSANLALGERDDSVLGQDGKDLQLGGAP